MEVVFGERQRCARDDHVRRPYQTFERFASFSRRKLQSETAFSGIKELMIRTGLDIRNVAQKWPQVAQIVARRRLDANHVVPLLR